MKRALAILAVVSMFGQGSPAFAQTPSPAVPLPSATPACSHPDRLATITYAVSPNYPDGAETSGEVKILVILDPDGRVTKTMIASGSGDPRLDAAAIRAALLSTYAPAIINCSTVGGTYMFHAEFEGGRGSWPNVDGPKFVCVEARGDATLLRAGVVHWPVDFRPTMRVSAVVKMTVNTDGNVTGASIDQSTGSAAADQAAVKAAKASEFAPACENSKPAESTFGYEVDFDPNAPSPLPSPKGTP